MARPLKTVEPIYTAHLFAELDRLLLGCLRKLTHADWERQTLAAEWSVKDVASHLLDNNIRGWSALHGEFKGERYSGPDTHEDLVKFLNTLNADWVRAFRRVSPAVLMDLLEITGKPYCEYMKSLDPSAPAVFPVAWAGESQSKNWFHVAREYTEKWHHQQQIRFAVGDDGVLLSDRFYLPYLDTSMRALPHHYRTLNASVGTTIRFIISGVNGAQWYLVRRDDHWELLSECDSDLSCSVEINKNAAWRIFTKGMSALEAQSSIHVSGEPRLGNHILGMVAVMA